MPQMEFNPSVDVSVLSVSEQVCWIAGYIPEEWVGDYGYDVGFYVGVSLDAMEKIPCEWSHYPTTFSIRMDGLLSDTQYVCCSYISNGHNIIYSEIVSFRTDPQKQ